MGCGGGASWWGRDSNRRILGRTMEQISSMGAQGLPSLQPLCHSPQLEKVAFQERKKVPSPKKSNICAECFLNSKSMATVYLKVCDRNEMSVTKTNHEDAWFSYRWKPNISGSLFETIVRGTLPNTLLKSWWEGGGSGDLFFMCASLNRLWVFVWLYDLFIRRPFCLSSQASHKENNK